MSDRLVTIAAVDRPVEAALMKNLLESAGIRTCLADEDAVATAWHLAGAMGGIKVQVFEADAERALALLEQHRPRREEDDAGAEASWDPGDSAAEAAAAGEGTEEDEEPASSREKAADRALRTVLLGALLPPLQLYASCLLVDVWLDRGPLTGKSRRNALIASALNLTLVAACVFLVGVLLWGRPGSPSARIDLRRFPHPERMVGVWQRIRPAAEGGSLETLELHPDGRLRYRDQGAVDLEGAGTWGYDDSAFFFAFRIDRFTRGEADFRGEFFEYRLQDLTDEVMTLQTGTGSTRYVRQGSAAARDGQ